MKYLVYVSQANRPFKSQDLEDLLAVSRRNNKRDSITGLLIYRFNEGFGRGNFLQVIEGPKAAIDGLWKDLSADQRHHTIIILDEGETQDRMFSDWSMGFRNFEDGDFRDYPGFAELGSDDFWAKAEQKALPGAFDALCSFYQNS